MPCQNCQFKSASDESLLVETRNLDLSDECKCSRGSVSKPPSGGCSCCSPQKPKGCSCCCGNCCACCRCCSGSRRDYCQERTEARVEQEQSTKSCASCKSCSAKKAEEERRIAKSTSCSCAKCA